MKNYERPTVILAGDPAEGVYMASGDVNGGENTDNTLTVAQAMDQIFGQGDGGQSAADGASGGQEVPATGGVPETGVAGEIAETPDEGEISDGAGVSGSALTGAAGDVQTAPEDAGGDTEDVDHELMDEASADMQGSAHVICNSRYMNGVWQAARQGAWGGMKLGCKELLGCTECPADNGDGCGLQKPNASQYSGKADMLMPGWEASGKGPNDDPYGIG